MPRLVSHVGYGYDMAAEELDWQRTLMPGTILSLCLAHIYKHAHVTFYPHISEDPQVLPTYSPLISIYL